MYPILKFSALIRFVTLQYQKRFVAKLFMKTIKGVYVLKSIKAVYYQSSSPISDEYSLVAVDF